MTEKGIRQRRVLSMFFFAISSDCADLGLKTFTAKGMSPREGMAKKSRRLVAAVCVLIGLTMQMCIVAVEVLSRIKPSGLHGVLGVSHCSEGPKKPKLFLS